MIYTIRKWRENKDRTGFVLQASAKDDAGEWDNIKIFVPVYQKPGEGKTPHPTTAIVKIKDGKKSLIMQCVPYDKYTPKAEKISANQENTVEAFDDDSDIPF